uniref:Uncharacterized protein n=1 Tax=Pyrodinium bahamense TaxID=73915 RepID=A0A7S0A5N6_9DINO|mmetsp:Transcript_2367/g.6753  ORF Transcript_2367/g.6753 Transcript_2367/m.6753 type:complete len:188 (+) Transcript_2367:90-653(+)
MTPVRLALLFACCDALTPVQRSLDDRRPDRKITVKWKVLEIEAGTNASFALDRGCSSEDDGQQTCEMDFKDTTNRGHVDIGLAQPLDASDILESTIQVKTPFVNQGFSMRCPICGSNCTSSFVGSRISLPMPECPIPAGTWRMEKGFGDLVPLGLTEFPMQGTISAQYKIVRNGGAHVMSWQADADF